MNTKEIDYNHLLIEFYKKLTGRNSKIANDIQKQQWIYDKCKIIGTAG